MDIPRIGRNTQGVRLINLTSDQRLVGVARVEEDNGRPAAELPEPDLVDDDEMTALPEDELEDEIPPE